MKHLWHHLHIEKMRLSLSFYTHVEDLETGNIQYTDEVLPLLLGVQSLVTLLDEPLEETIEDTLAEGTDGVGDLVLVTTLGDELVSDLDAGLEQVLVQVLAVDAKELGNPLTLLELDIYHK